MESIYWARVNMDSNAIRLAFVVLLMAVGISSIPKQSFTSRDDVCRLFKNGVKLRKPGSCNAGIECQNHKSEPGVQCIGDKPYYSRDSTDCAKSDSDSYCKSPCVKKSFGYISDQKSCSGWYQCNGATVLLDGNCDYNLYFDEDNGLCNYPELVKCSRSYELCDVTPNDVPILDEDNCHKYYVCKKGQLKHESCATSTYFDVETGSCIDKAMVNCYKHPLPNEVCGNNKIALRNRFVADGATCRGYFYCKDLGVGVPDKSPRWDQCPETLFFHPNEMACQTRAHVKCNEDRCDGIVDGFEISAKLGCQHFLRCQNNRTEEELYCGDGQYFNVETKTCTTIRKSYPACN